MPLCSRDDRRPGIRNLLAIIKNFNRIAYDGKINLNKRLISLLVRTIKDLLENGIFLAGPLNLASGVFVKCAQIL